MAKKKKAHRRSPSYQLPRRHRPPRDLISLSKAAGLASLRFVGSKVNVVTSIRNNWNLRGFILTCFFFSGLASLIYQVLWVRQLGLIFGTTLQSVSTVLAVFMAGLALGSYLFGKIADKTGNPLRLFAYLEIGIGVYVMLIPLIFMALNSVQVSIYASLPVGHAGVTILRVLGCFLVLIVPTTLMGGTLPVIAKFFVRREEELGGGIGNLYFINTLGAVFGAFLAGFVLIPYIGVLASTFLAASIDFAIGVIFFLLQKYKIKPVEEPPPEEEVIEEAPLQLQLTRKQKKRQERDERKRARLRPPAYSKAMKRVVFIGLALGGLAALSLEVSWTRVLSMVLGSSVYAFSLMLTAFLLGIALGSAIAAKFVDRVKHLWVYFFVVQALIGIAVVVLNPLLGELPLLFVRVFPNIQQNFWLLQFVEFLLLLLIMLVPTLLMGAAFPIAARIYTDDVEHLGGSVGRLYAGNTFGSMVGPLLTGFLIIPLIGIQWSVSLVSIIYLAVAGVVFVVGFRSHLKAPVAEIKRFTRFMAGVAGVIVLAVLVINILIPTLGAWDRRILNSGVFLYADNYEEGNIRDRFTTYGQLLYYNEGLLSTVAVYDEADGNRSLTIDGKVDASTSGDLPTEIISGHLPMLLHDDPKEVLLIGLGSGITLGAVELYPTLVNVEAVEIEGAVIEAAGYFKEANGDALNNEKLDMIQADARNYVLAQTKTDKEYDVITAEPSNPWMAGNSILFTREQFELYKKVLSDDGIVCQWLHYYSMSLGDLKTVLNTFTDVFPNATLWRTTSDLLLIGTKNKQSIDFAALNARLQQEDYADVIGDMKRVDVDDIYDVLGAFVMGPTALANFSDGAPMHADNHPILQFSAPKSLHSETSIKDNIWSLQQSAQNIEDIDSLLIHYEDEANLSEEIQKQREFFIQFTSATISAQDNDMDGVISALTSALATGTKNSLTHRLLGTWYVDSGEYDVAAEHFAESVTLNPTHAVTWIKLAANYRILGKNIEAIAAMNKAIELVADNALLYIARSRTYLLQEEYATAIDDCSRAINLHPGVEGDDLAYARRGLIHVKLALNAESEEEKITGIENALSDANVALNLDSKQAVAHVVLGQINYQRGLEEVEFKEARRYYDLAIAEYEKAISADPRLPDPYMHLGIIHFELGYGDQAFSSINEAIKQDGTYAEAYYNRGRVGLTMIAGHQYPDLMRGQILSDFERVIILASGTGLAERTVDALAGFIDDLSEDLPQNPEDATNDDALTYYFRGQAYNILYWALADRDDKTLAIADYDKVIELESVSQLADNAQDAIDNIDEFPRI